MRCEKIYYADDGTKFVGNNAYADCAEYELALQDKKYASLKPYVQFYNFKGEPIRMALIDRNGVDNATFIYIDSIPLDDDLYDVWYRLVPEDIADSCCGNDSCWWVNINDTWVSWNEMQKTFYQYADQIEKIEKNNS